MTTEAKYYRNPDYRTFRTTANLERFIAWLEREIAKCTTPKQEIRLHQFADGLERARSELDWRRMNS